MKRILLLIFAILLLLSCSNQTATQEPAQPVEMKLLAGVNKLESKAAVESWANTPVYFAKGSSAATYDQSWKAIVSSTGTVVFSPVQYYPLEETEKVFLRGYAPRGTFDAGVVRFAGMDGTQDILLSGEVSGSVLDRFDQPSKEFSFTHSLAQLNFVVVADPTFERDVNLTSISVHGTKLPVAMDIVSGNIQYADFKTAIASFKGVQPINPIVSDKLGTVMVEPGKVVTLTIVAGDITYDNVPIVIDGASVPQAGTAYTVTLTFVRNGINLTSTIVPWSVDVRTGVLSSSAAASDLNK